MSTVEEIERAIAQLVPSDYEKIRRWLLEFDNQVWDREMIEDANAGRMDALAREALADLEGGRASDL